jgi:hypothetical protein
LAPPNSFHRDALAFLGARDEIIELATEHVGGAPHRDPIRDPAIPPVGCGKAADPLILTGRADQALTAASARTPAAGQRRMVANVDLILEVEVGPEEEIHESGDIGGNVVPHANLAQGMPVERDGQR